MRCVVSKLDLYGKKNQDGSYSVSFRASDLAKNAFVDFYDDSTGRGYQRLESLRAKRGREISAYIERCVRDDLPPRLFELTANARQQPGSDPFDPIDEEHVMGILQLAASDEPWLSVIDGGTRLLGIENALAAGIISPQTTFDVRVFVNLSIGEEIAQFLLINEKQKRVRTDLSLRVVQRQLDDDSLGEHEMKILQTVVPESDSWKFEASRIVGWLNARLDSPWQGLIKMPNDSRTRPVKLQAFFSSLKPLLTNPDLVSVISNMEKSGTLPTKSRAEFIYRILVNFWSGVRDANPEAAAEPRTNVLWGSIGVNACHIGLAPILVTILRSPEPDVTGEAFLTMHKQSEVADYPYWFTKPGTQKPKDSYPGDKGEAPRMTGAANYGRLGKQLETQWRSALHATPKKSTVRM